MIASPLPAIRELSARILADLAQALRVGHLTGTATALMVRYAVPAVGEAAAVELSSLLASGLGPQHAALLLDALTAEREPRAHAADLELVTSGPDIAGATRDTGVVLRELFAEAEHRVLVVGFAVHQGREIFAALADRMQQRADLAVRLCLDVRGPPATPRGRTRCCAGSLSASFARNGRDHGYPICFAIPAASPQAKVYAPAFTRSASLSMA